MSVPEARLPPEPAPTTAGRRDWGELVGVCLLWVVPVVALVLALVHSG